MLCQTFKKKNRLNEFICKPTNYTPSLFASLDFAKGDNFTKSSMIPLDNFYTQVDRQADGNII